MTTLTAIVAAIVAALAADLGTIDLSATDQVQEGTFTSPPGSVAFAAVLPPALVESEAQARGDLYLDTYRVEIRLWAPVTLSTAGDRASRGRLIQGEARAALETARSTKTSALYRCAAFTVLGTEPSSSSPTAAPGWAYTALIVEWTYRRASGTGA